MFASFARAIAEGIGLGITLAILTGPAFFALLQTSIRNGYKSGIAFAIGVFFSDTTLILLSYLGALRIFSDPKNNFVIGIIGGTILIMFGIFNIFQKHPLDLENGAAVTKIISSNNHVNLILVALKGFGINLINPFVILFWIGVVSVESTRYEFSHMHVAAVFSATLFTVLFTDILKSMGAHKITSVLNPNILHWINRIAGVILIISGVTLIWKVVKTFL
ncbi:MAG: LysE family transporter [Bacteroidetes bacterium]|nr:LysE family transporter [Bacteroidota bacterium]